MKKPLKYKQVTAPTSWELYLFLEYYRHHIPFFANMSEGDYAETQEAKNVDAALDAYRKETGVKACAKPSV